MKLITTRTTEAFKQQDHNYGAVCRPYWGTLTYLLDTK